VDAQGNIQFQGLGTLRIEGLTKQQLTDLLNSRLKEFLQNPYYSIRFLNYKVTLIGEVTREGVYQIPNERVNVLEAIGLAGGLTVYAKRQNVMVIRESNGKREFARLDLTSPDLFNSPYYFLKQNDMVVIEQTKNKLANTDQTTARNISLASGVISTLLFVYTVFR
jgi:polysaccharide export outer membrane protein